MTIRYTCPECSSVLKIKDDLAGTGARCPKCKRKFVVPDGTQEESAQITLAVDEDEQPAKDNDVKKSRQKPLINEALSSTEMTTVSDDAQSIDALERIRERRDKQSLAAGSEPSGSTLSNEGNHKSPTNEFRTAPTVADSSHFHLQLEDDDSSDSSEMVANNQNRSPAKYTADDDDDDSSGMVANTENRSRTTYSADDDDDDDLDSPAILVSIPIPDADSSLSPPKTNRKPSSFTPSFEAPQAGDAVSDLSTKKTVPQAFDPAKFLLEDEKPKLRGAPKSYLEDEDSDLELSDDSDYDVLNPPTPYPPKRPVAPVGNARSAPEKVDLAAAAKMMKKAIKDAQSDATRLRQREANPGFDYGLFFREIGFRGLALILGLAVMVFASILVGNYFFSSKLRTPPLSRVTGQVTLDGQPLSNATVFFRPLDTTIKKGRRDQARTSIGITDDKGRFEMMYSPADRIRGVTVGQCIYWVDHVGPKGNDVPSNWTEYERRQFEVKAGESSVVDIQMASGHR